MARITGDRAHRARLLRMRGPRMVASVGAALFAGGHLIQTTAQIKITNGAVSGAGHVPSLPGQPPNADTHTLANGIETNQVAPLKVEVEAIARTKNGYNYALIERGNSRVDARPYLGPSVHEKRREVTQLVHRAVEAAIRGG